MHFADCTTNGVKDIVFVIDNSYYTRYRRFKVIREFVDYISISLKLNSPESSVAVILFDNTARIHFNLEAYTNLSMLSLAIDPLLPYSGHYGYYYGYYYGYNTGTAAALRLLLSSAQDGSLGIRNETSNVAIVITGGRSYDYYSTQSAAAALHAANIFDVYAIGYNSANIYELNTIASDPHFVYFTNFYNLFEVEELRMNVINQLCSSKSLALLSF